MRKIVGDKNIDFNSMEQLHKSSWQTVIESNIARQFPKASGSKKKYLNEITSRLGELLTAKPDKLREHKDEIEILKKFVSKSKKELKALDGKLLAAFSYDKFIQTDLPKWGAYKYTESLNVNACVYCNRTYTFTLDLVEQARRFNKARALGEKRKILKNISGKTRPELDHFYPKVQFPYLSLSLYNLIPSCHICNSNLKGSRKLNFDEYLNPYEDDFHELIKITPKLRNEAEIQDHIDKGLLIGAVKDHFGTQIFNGKLSSFDFVFSEKSPRQTISNAKAQKHIRLYALRELYEMHKQHAARIILNSIAHGRGAAADIFSRHKNLFHSEEEVRNALFVNETNPDRINQSPLSKLTIDILDDFGI